MKLKYKTLPDSEGGSAVPGCGTIHISEIKATLTKLSDDLEFPFDLNDYTMGSTGKSEYSGDIDVVLDDRWWGHGAAAFRENLVELYGLENTARNGAMIHLKYPIVGYNAALNKRKPRTGFVQVDFNFGNYEWEKFYHYSLGDDSEYKGAHRNLMISAICAVIDVHPFIDLNDPCPCIWEGDRPANIIRWKWGENGLIRVNRRSVKDKHGHWKRKQEDTTIAGPYIEPKTIIDILFPGYHNIHALDSMETIMTAVKATYGMVEQERVWQRSAANFYDWKDGRNFYYPEEISKYFPIDDK